MTQKALWRKELQESQLQNDVRGALCQMRCPERDKEPIENHSLIVSPCIMSSSNVCTLQECNNKGKQQPAKILLLTISFICWFIHDRITDGTDKSTDK